MKSIKIKEIGISPEFDMFSYCELAGDNRLDQETLDELGERWDQWTGRIKAFELLNPVGGAKYLLIFMDQEVEQDIEEAWRESPVMGLALHNLAICMVMSAAQGLIPELAEGSCAPLPKPGPAIQEAFEDLGLAWSVEGTINRRFAVFTPYPYAGGCEICYLEQTCPRSRTKA
ncbi:MAG: hypothetical protein PHV85_11010 [Desulfovibrionaceae bacterium]|nr:hypothetical protein [Desulfovibrionaceae bacterium]